MCVCVCVCVCLCIYKKPLNCLFLLALLERLHLQTSSPASPEILQD